MSSSSAPSGSVWSRFWRSAAAILDGAETTEGELLEELLLARIVKLEERIKTLESQRAGAVRDG